MRTLALVACFAAAACTGEKVTPVAAVPVAATNPTLVVGAAPLERSMGPSTFSLATPPASEMLLLKFQAKNVRPREATVTVNGNDIADVPPDNIAADRVHEVLIPAGLLKKDGTNTLTFANSAGATGREGCRDSTNRLETLSMPLLSDEEVLAQVRAALEQGRRALQASDGGQAGLYEAWKQLRAAQLGLMALKVRPPELEAAIKQELDRVKTLLDAPR
jgi:hypothetical protein